MDRLMRTLHASEVTWGGVLITLSLGVALSVGGFALVSFLLVKLPARYFCDERPLDIWVDRHLIIRWAGRVLKNTLGVAAVFLGLMLALPGIPGPGLLLLLIGLTLIDFPGKRRLGQKLVARAGVLQAINELRRRFGKPPLVLAKKD